MNQALSVRNARTVATESVAEAFLAALKDRGIDCLYVGAGTDTAPIIEAYARARDASLSFPEAVLAVHENLAVGMAHGYYMVTRRPQAIVLHVSVGTANAVCGLFNAARAQVPIFLCAGRTPWFEQGRLGSRSHEVHWAQEMFDQGGMVRELVKWDYELRDGLNVVQIVDRALSIAMAEPRGPVYLTLPREVLAQHHDVCELGDAVPVPYSAHPDPVALTRLAQALAEAECPVIVCTNSGADPATVPLLGALAERYGIGIAENRPRYISVASDHPLHLGFDTVDAFAHADALLFLDSDVPWIPSVAEPKPSAFVAHAASDPLFVNYPVRNFRSDLTLTSNVAALLEALDGALAANGALTSAPARRERLEALARERRAAARDRARRDALAEGPISKLFLSRCIDEVKSDDAIVVNEYSAIREQMTFRQSGTFFQLPSAGGLGWGLPAALGAQQASPGREVICVLGDGAYLFANPAACHQAAAMHGLPVLIVIYNNAGWAGVEQSATGMYPDAHAAKAVREYGAAPLSSLQPIPDFEKYVEASGGYGERVTRREDLVPALQRALAVVRTQGRQALLNVIGS